MRLIDADQFGVISLQGKSEDFIEGAKYILEKIDEAPTVERPQCTEERAIDFLHDTGWMQRHDEEMTRPQWIPCSERLPDGCGELLITADYNGTLVTYSAWFNTLTNKFERVPKEHIVLAWMPVPEPYQKEGEADG